MQKDFEDLKMEQLLIRYGMEIQEKLLSYGAEKTLEGECIQASEMLLSQLTQDGIAAEEGFGFCLYDDFDCCTDRPVSSHYFLIVRMEDDWWYVDPTAIQFDFCLAKKQPEVLVLKNQFPYWLRLEEPTDEELEELGW